MAEDGRPEEALPAGLPQSTAHTGPVLHSSRPHPARPLLSFPLTPGRGAGTGHPHLVKAKAMRLRMVKLRRVMVCGR